MLLFVIKRWTAQQMLSHIDLARVTVSLNSGIRDPTSGIAPMEYRLLVISSLVAVVAVVVVRVAAPMDSGVAVVAVVAAPSAIARINPSRSPHTRSQWVQVARVELPTITPAVLGHAARLEPRLVSKVNGQLVAPVVAL
jgi:hypothetical protein